MQATDVLREEHRAVERVLRVLETAADRLEGGKDVPPAVFEQSLDFIRNFADRCHHGKEEDLLFPALEKAGVPRDRGPLGVMLAEHDRGRRFVREMGQALSAYQRGDPAARPALATAARGYVELLSQHIQKEDNVLFVMGDRALSPAVQQDLVEGFERIEQERIGPGEHERYHQTIHELEDWAAGAA